MEQDTITFNTSILACEEAGVFCHCYALYVEAYSDGLLDHWLESSSSYMDLHFLPASVARAAVRFV